MGFVSFNIFPDFADILKIFNSVNEEQNLGFSKEVLLNEGTVTTVGIQILDVFSFPMVKNRSNAILILDSHKKSDI